MINDNLARFSWQNEFVEHYSEFVTKNGFLPFFLEAGVGSGKTQATLRVAKMLLEKGEVDFIVYVCPTTAIRDGCVEEASNCFAMSLQTKVPQWKHPSKDYVGCVITYASLGYAVKTMRIWRNNGVRICLLLDELHRAKQDAIDPMSWGKSVSDAIQISKATIGFSGTPFTSTGSRLAGFERCYSIDGPTKEQRFKPDFLFTVEEGLIAGTVREVNIRLQNGKFWYDECPDNFMMISDVKNPDLIERDDEETKDYWQKMESMCLWSIAGVADDWFSRTIHQVDLQLDELRQTDSKAKCLIVVAPGGPLRDAPGRIEKITGQQPVVVSYEDKESGDKISEFKDSDHRYIISVNKISEGVNIPNLRILVMATTYKTDLSFIQMLGRVMRWPNQDPNKSCGWAYLPETQRNQQRAMQWRIRQERALKQRKPRDTTVTRNQSDFENGMLRFGNELGASTTVIATDELATQAELDWARHCILSKKYGHIAEETFVRIARDFGIEPEHVAVERGDSEKKKKFHRKESYRIAQRLRYKTNLEFNLINFAINKRQGVQSVDDVHDNYPWEKMKERHDILLQWLNDGGVPDQWLSMSTW